jgi:UDP-N-acetylglucosamine/UDP-N-acetylgalactosamine 4-epimerase
MRGMSLQELLGARRRWLVTGCAGFIGSNLIETLLSSGQEVVGIDNLSSGSESNLHQVQSKVGANFRSFTMIKGDIRNPQICADACERVHYVLHHAAIASVPLSIGDPCRAHDVNVTGTLALLDAARRSGVRRFVYASSSAVYGDCSNTRQSEDMIGNPLSPYAATKRVNELYAALYSRTYGLDTMGLRYFNVYGPRQDPNGAYAAVIPRWIEDMIADRIITINGSADISRDFCFVEDVVQANVRAAATPGLGGGEVFNVASNHETKLGELFAMIRQALLEAGKDYQLEPVIGPHRVGDIRHSAANIDKAREELRFSPQVSLAEGLVATIQSFRNRAGQINGSSVNKRHGKTAPQRPQ